MSTEAQIAQRRRNVQKIAADRRKRTRCKRGHKMTPKNTYRTPSDGHRECLTCKRDRAWYRYRGFEMVA